MACSAEPMPRLKDPKEPRSLTENHMDLHCVLLCQLNRGDTCNVRRRVSDE